MWKIYLDMDGVLSDFEKRFVELFGRSASSIGGTFTESAEWERFVTHGHFETLDWFPGGKELLQFLGRYDVPIEILSSSGGHKYHKEISEQKTIWLKNNDIHYPVNIVPGKKYKKDYADVKHILIDDTERNVVEFIESGGLAFLHKTPETTISNLEKLL
jgi:hypothetical protein